MRVEARVIESRDSIRRQELADFLRSRRERTSPAEAGLRERPRRRTPGLRREDLADLAGISATWYTRLEQGRDIRASVSVVERLARALRLDSVERTQLFQLALRQTPPISRGPKEKLSPLLQRVLRHLDSLPALVLGIEAAFPTGSVRRGLGAGAYELRPFLAALKVFGPVVLQGNIGWSRVLASRSRIHGESIVGGISISAPLIARKLYGFAELSGSKVVNRWESIVTVAPGLKWLWSDGTSVTVALPIPLSGNGLGFGIVTQFERGF